MPVAVSHQKKSSLRIAAWIVAALLVIGICSELLLRFVLGLGNPVVVVPDAACAYTLAPDQNTFRFFCHTHTNSYGMRSDAFASVPAPGTLRIMFVGDSVTYGTSHVDQSRIFTEVLHRELPAVVHQPVEVLNGSAGAWAIDNELSWLRSRGTFHANIVVLVLNSGDLAQPRAQITDVGDDTAQSHSHSALGEVWTRILKPRLFRHAPHVDAGDVAGRNAATIRANLAELDDFQKLTAAAGARMVLLYIPFRHEIPNPAAQSEETLTVWTAAHHVPFFDMTSTEAVWPVHAISLDGVHLNARGNQVVAGAVEKEWDSKMSP